MQHPRIWPRPAQAAARTHGLGTIRSPDQGPPFVKSTRAAVGWELSAALARLDTKPRSEAEINILTGAPSRPSLGHHLAAFCISSPPPKKISFPCFAEAGCEDRFPSKGFPTDVGPAGSEERQVEKRDERKGGKPGSPRRPLPTPGTFYSGHLPGSGRSCPCWERSHQADPGAAATPPEPRGGAGGEARTFLFPVTTERGKKNTSRAAPKIPLCLATSPS